MSILLEALRKSERGQRSREVPTIHTEVPSGSTSRPRSILPIVLLIVIALIICGWFVWNQYWVPAEENTGVDDGTVISSSEQPATEADSSNSNVEIREATGQKSEPQAAANNVTKTNDSTAVSSSQQSGQKSGRPRTPTELYQSPADNVAKSNAAGTVGETKKSDSSRPSQTRRTGIAATDLTDTAENHNSSSGSDSGSSAQYRVSEEEAKSRAIQPIGYWQLPDSAREVVPIIKYSVLVYNKNPAERFVLVNGERLAEGDSLQPGLEVKEIRRDGVIFSYRLYQFLVEK